MGRSAVPTVAYSSHISNTAGDNIMYKKFLLIMSATFLLTVGSLAQDGSKPTATPAAAKTEESKKAPIFRPTKDQIKQVQTILVSKKLYAGQPSGKYDDDTRAGIKTFQKGNGLKETGTLNRATLEKFGVALTDGQKKIPVNPNSYSTGGDSSKTKSSGSEDKPKRTAPFRANKDQVTAAQKLLKKMSMYSGEETGKLDDATRDGLKKYQESKAMKATGTLNAVTLQKMGIDLTDKQKESLAEQK